MADPRATGRSASNSWKTPLLPLRMRWWSSPTRSCSLSSADSKKLSITWTGWSTSTSGLVCSSEWIPGSPPSAGIPGSRRRSSGWGCPSSKRLQQRIQRRHNGHGNPCRGRPPYDRPLQRFHLDALALCKIDEQRGAHRPRYLRRIPRNPIDHVVCNSYLFGPGNLFDLATSLEELGADLNVSPQRTDGQPRRAGESGKRGQEDELFPDGHAPVFHRFCLD